MTSSNRRTALLTGASIAALGIATPAFAAPHDTYAGIIPAPGTNTTSSTVTICDIAGSEPCFFGDIESGSPTANATVNSTANGQIFQHNTGTTDLVLNNLAGSSAEVGAIASATTSWSGSANAVLSHAVHQSAHLGDTVTAELHNGGNLLIDASAVATGWSGAQANATIVDYGIGQFVGSASTASALVSNTGTMTIAGFASASATLSGAATATAHLDSNTLPLPGLIVQSGAGVDGDLTLQVNNGAGDTLNLDMTAIANGDTANANATLTNGIVQFGIFASTMDLGVSNLGDMNIGAHATANGGTGGADAVAHVGDGILEIALFATTANETVTNKGDLEISAIAKANANDTGGALGSANANADIDFGIAQLIAFDDVASAKVSNTADGTIDIVASAVANGTNAQAYATVGDGTVIGLPMAGIAQAVFAASTANASVTNDGAIGITAVAHANGTTFASANANADGIHQIASATDGAASASIDNNGTLDVHATAIANAANTDTTLDGAAFAHAYVSFGASQEANGNTATVTLNNGAAGAIDVGALAKATGTAAGSVHYSGGWATAHDDGAAAYVNNGLVQHANAGTYTTTTDNDTFAGNAVAQITNAGTISIHATATAKAVVTADATSTSAGLAHASAVVNHGVSQYATSTGGDATVSLDNTNSIAIDAVANATGNDVVGVGGSTWDGYYDAPGALAAVNVGINQNAVARPVNIGGTAANPAGTATYTTNTWGSPGWTNTYTYNTTKADFLAGNASASLTNSGTIHIEASANADATGQAFASAYVGTGIHQHASAPGFVVGHGSTAETIGGGNATVTLTNSSLLSIDILATAQATGATATANAEVNTGITQVAYAGFGDATVSLINGGAIAITALASANGTNNADANADVDGIYQYASAPLGVGSITLDNDGTIDVKATAIANAASVTNATSNAEITANANAYASQGISQEAHGTSANVAVTNGPAGVINVIANASAVAPGITVAGTSSDQHIVIPHATAHANVGTGIEQVANASNQTTTTGTDTAGPATSTNTNTFAGSANAVANVTNSGTINVGATAFASGADASAGADIEYGIEQDVGATGGTAANATANIVNAGPVGGAAAGINVTASASAVGVTNASAYATVDTGINQEARAVSGGAAVADVNLTNTGAINIAATANAAATGSDINGFLVNGHASAYASVDTGIHQQAGASGHYLVSSVITTGVDVATVCGVAVTGTTTAKTYAGTASAKDSLTNSGTIDISASANATGGATGGGANAYATIGYGISQYATAYAADSANATATLVNSGTINVNASAAASGNDFAEAIASVETAILQSASASATDGPANASVSLTNSNTIDISAAAKASGDYAYASASVGRGIWQNVTAVGTAGTASAILDNSGDISVAATATANGDTSWADAYAEVGTGIWQSVSGPDKALASLNNTVDGSISVLAAASASGQQGGGAYATIDYGISQNATATLAGGVATAEITNVGAITVSASAVGFAGDDGAEAAYASIETGIFQYAKASSAANVTLDNSGTINVLAAASASADEDAAARATIDTVAYQSAFASGDGGDASVSFTNSGTLNAAATATAVGGGDVSAEAYIENGVIQNAFGGDTGSAKVSFVNTNTVSMVAQASALGGGDGNASASASGISQFASAGGGASASLSNTDSITVSAAAKVLVGNAAHRGASAFAEATATGIEQGARARTSTGTMANVFTDAFTVAASLSDTLPGVVFTASETSTNSASGPALVTLTNSGSLVVTADASAVADNVAVASAFASAVYQNAQGSVATASVSNAADATISATAAAFASGQNGASANADAYGVSQNANGTGYHQITVDHGTATLHLTTNSCSTAASTTARGILTTAETVTRTTTPTGAVKLSLTNSGSINVDAQATAIAAQGGPAVGATSTTPAFASAFAEGVDQQGRGATALLTVDNSGSLTVTAGANASGATAADAVAGAQGIVQQGNSVGTETVQHYQLGTATYTSDGHPYTYTTLLLTDSAVTHTNVGSVTESIVNSGSVDVAAVASATAGTAASATATATGALQIASGATVAVSVSNTADATLFDVLASAAASGTTAFASANAYGIVQQVNSPDVTIDDVNAGTINVTAHAVAAANVVNGTGATATTTAGVAGVNNASAFAHAVGISVNNAATTTTTTAGTPVVTTTHINAQPLGGSITNSGTLNVLASAEGNGGYTTLTTAGAGTLTTTLYNSAATATGIKVTGGVNNMTITNSGSINVDAVTANGGPAKATGILVTGNGDVTALPTDVLTINNSGDIIVRISQDGGDTFLRGMAIDVSAAPNKTVINLMGNGDDAANIYGNIDTQAGDAINVTDGETVFNGIINPECMPAGGPTALTLDSSVQSLCGTGALTLTGGGDFHMVIDDQEGPSYAFVDSLTVNDDGTLELDLPAAVGGTIPIGTYPQIFADTVTLNGGTLIANIANAGNGLYETTVYENVIDGQSLTGTFDQCIAPGVPTDSLLLDFGCVYPPAAGVGNVDLKLTRVPFDEVPGLNGNGEEVGDGLECIYDVTLTGGIADMLSDLFLISDPVKYNTALNELSGSSYANYLNSFPSLGVHYNDLVDHATNCEVPSLAGSVLECRASAPLHIWGDVDYQWRKADGDSEAGSTKARRFTGQVGLDASVGGAAIIGAEVGYVTNHTRDRQFGDTVSADGMQVGAYAVYDPGAFYLKGVTTYSWYDGDSKRHINFAPFGGTFASTPTGDPDVNMWTFGLHGGARFPIGNASVLTPYLNYDYVNAKLKGFTESGGNGADLTVEGSHSKHSFLTGGVKWATQMGGVVPEVNLGYRYRMGHRYSTITEAFNGDTACDFDIVSASQKRGTFLAGVSIGGKMGAVDLRIGYEGEFNGDVTSHSGNFKFVLPLGGHAAPPPPPPVVAPPPPPPPVEEVAPPPPPPPPPPVERGERGQ